MKDKDLILCMMASAAGAVLGSYLYTKGTVDIAQAAARWEREQAVMARRWSETARWALEKIRVLDEAKKHDAET